AHGAVGIESLRLAEGALGLAMVKRVGETQALIKISLRAVVRSRNLVSDGPETVPQWRLGVCKPQRRTGCAHLGAWYFSLGQAQHHLRQAGCGRRVADRKFRADEWRGYI